MITRLDPINDPFIQLIAPDPQLRASSEAGRLPLGEQLHGLPFEIWRELVCGYPSDTSWENPVRAQRCLSNPGHLRHTPSWTKCCPKDLPIVVKHRLHPYIDSCVGSDRLTTPFFCLPRSLKSNRTQAMSRQKYCGGFATIGAVLPVFARSRSPSLIPNSWNTI